MGIWDPIRFFSSALRKSGRHGTGRNRKRGKCSIVKQAERHRGLRLERFEDRVLLSISPTGVERAWENTLTDAIEIASDLSRYSTEDMQGVQQWVVGLEDYLDADQAAAAVGADMLDVPSGLKNAYIWEFSTAVGWETAADRMESLQGIDYFYPLVPLKVERMLVPNDPLFGDQWHLQNVGQTGGTPGEDANVTGVWDNYDGSGVVISVVDDGIDPNHPDLIPNYRADLSWDYSFDDPDPSHEFPSDAHGTSVAGVAAAAGNNGIGVAGAGFEAEIAAIRWLSANQSEPAIASSLSHRLDEIDISNNSWGPIGPATLGYSITAGPGPLALQAMNDGVTLGRDGLGTIYTFAAGNDGDLGDNVNYDGWASSRFTIAVAAVDHNGVQSWYSEPGAPLLISAYSNGAPGAGITTTDRLGADGYDPGDYTNTFGGTSSATPLVSGVIALMLQANPDLTYRDVQHILVESARQTDPTDTDWVTNGAGYHVNHKYGFGVIDAEAAVSMAESWENVLPEVAVDTGDIPVGATIPDDSQAGLSSTVSVDNTVNSIEWVEVNVDIPHNRVGDLELVLVSPSGTESVLAEPHVHNPFSTGYQWTFTSARHWGEQSVGDWTLIARDLQSGTEGVLESWRLSIYGQQLPQVGPELVAVIPNEGGLIEDGSTVNVSPRELLLRFNRGQEIDDTTLDAIRVVRSGGDGTFGDGNEVEAPIGWIGIGDAPNEVIVRFAEHLPDDNYRLIIDGTGEDALLNLGSPQLPFQYDPDTGLGQDLELDFELNLGPRVVAVVPQPVSRDAQTGALVQAQDTVEVYFNDDDLDASVAENPNQYTLIALRDPGSTADDYVVPSSEIRSVSYDTEADKVTLVFEQNLDAYGTGAFRLRVGNEYRPIATSTMEMTVDAGTSFLTAHPLDEFDGTRDQSLTLTADITSHPYYLVWPGGIDEPGHRDLPEHEGLSVEDHFGSDYMGDTSVAVQRRVYYFPDVYGQYPAGNTLHNAITEQQKQRVREIFELYGRYLGIQFVESAGQQLGAGDFAIVTGDARALEPTIPPGVSLAGGGRAIMSDAINWGNSEFGGAWFTTAMHEIGHLLALGHSYDLPPLTIMGSSEEGLADASAEPVFPGDHDIVHGRYLYRPDSNDIDTYRFTLEQAGTLTLETIAERLQQASELDTLISLYDENHELIARNDDSLSKDSFLSLHLTPGQYYVTVTASGNDNFDPHIENTGIGGRTQGEYDLRLEFRPDRDPVNVLTDATGVPLDGDGDGRPGGTYDFWFNVQSYDYTDADPDNDHVIFVDKSVDTWPAPRTGPLGSPTNPYSNIQDAFAAARPGGFDLDGTDGYNGYVPGDIVRVVGNNFANDNFGRTLLAVAGSELEDGMTFSLSDETQTVVFEFDSDDPASVTPDRVAVPFTAAHGATTVASSIASAINEAAETHGLNLSAEAMGSEIRVDGRAVFFEHRDSPITNTLQDNLAYEIGFDRLGRALSDGTKMEVPEGVTVMVDAGAVFKLRRANIDRGSSSLLIDRSRGALQVLGTPDHSVYFTSYDDESIGVDTFPGTATTASKGDWGGLVFRNDYDYQELLHDSSRRVFERAGIFLDYVNHADIRYGGGVVVVNGSEDVYTPIHMVEARPTVSYNRISRSADAAMSADPNSFEETHFRSTTQEEADAFTADYTRVGPDISDNFLADNSINGLFVRIRTDAGVPLDRLEVPAQFDDLDIVHVIPENLVIAGTPGGNIIESGSNQLTVQNRNQIRAIATRDPVDPVNGPRINNGDYFFVSDGFATVKFEFNVRSAAAAPHLSAGKEKIIIPIRLTDSATTVAEQVRQAIELAQDAFRLNATPSQSGDVVTVDGPTIYLDGFRGTERGYTLWRQDDTTGITAPNVVATRTDARLDIAPGTIVKLWGGRIETQFGAQLSAEGNENFPVVFTSVFDDRYGGSGTFDTSNDSSQTEPQPGNWAGLGFAPNSNASLDWARVFYAGGEAPIEGGFAKFDPVEIRQADVRIAHSLFQYNTADSAGDRNGRGSIEPATIFVRGAQPVLVGNTFRDNDGAVASFDANSLNAVVQGDWGRSVPHFDVLRDFPDQATRTPLDRVEDYDGNYGPLVRENFFDNNGINGMVVRGGVLTTESIWDDIDIAHVLWDEIVIPNHHTYSGLRLQSSEAGSLVVKLSTEDPFSGAQNPDAGFTAMGTPMEIDDRIGGTIQIIGWGNHPVVLTSLADDSVAAGWKPGASQEPQFDTDNAANTPSAGDWRSIRLERYANDRNVAIINESELAHGVPTGSNDTVDSAQYLGTLAPDMQAGDDALRLGFQVQGFVRYDSPGDVDVYRFEAKPGTEVWIDIDRSQYPLDTIVELIDANGQVVAWSDNSYSAEEMDVPPAATIPDRLAALPMRKEGWTVEDYYTQNPRDAGFRAVLPGGGSDPRSYYVRVRAASRALSMPSGRDISDGETFILRNGIGVADEFNTVVFEFDTDGSVAPGNVAVPIAAGDLPNAIAQQTAQAINSADMGLRGTAVDGTVVLELEGEPGYVPGPGKRPSAVIIAEVEGTQIERANPAGAYQLQVRLRELNELSGSTIRHADIRYATNGVELFGQPTHSPLLGESIDIEERDAFTHLINLNDTRGSAQPIGNLLGSDREALGVGGYLNGASDIDFYQFNVDLKGIQSIGGVNDMGTRWPVVFDLDYADGLTRADATMYVFDSDGRLVYMGSDSDIDGDRSAPGEGLDGDDLSRGSFGDLDPFIGPVYLAEGNNQSYYIAVSNRYALPEVINEYTQDFLLRREPINSIQRIVEDHIGSQNGSGVAEDALYTLFPGEDALELNLAADEFSLNDVIMYVTDGGELYTVNPFTGEMMVDVTGPGSLLPEVASRGRAYQDIAMRNDGRLISVSFWGGQYQESQFVWHDTGDATVRYNPGVTVGTWPPPEITENLNGITLGEVDPGNPDQARDIVPETGIDFTAFAFDPFTDTSSRYTVAVGDFARRGNGVQYWQNMMYVLDENGQAVQRPLTSDGPRVTSDIIPLGVLETPATYDVDPVFVPTPADDVDPVYVSQGLNDNFDPVYVPAGPYADHIVFSSHHDFLGSNPEGDYELFLMDPSGNVVEQLTDNDSAERFPDISPDGAKIVFVSDRDGNNDIYMMDLAPEDDGTNPAIRLTLDAWEDTTPHFSPGGLVIAGVPGSNLTDGQTFTLDDGPTMVTFEFDDEGNVAGANEAVAFTGGDTAATVASAIADAINNSVLNITARAQGDEVWITSRTADFDAGTSPLSAAEEYFVTFASRTPRNDREIRLMKATLFSSILQITNNDIQDATPAFSYDGNRIVYATNYSDTDADPEINPEGDYEIVWVPANTAPVTGNPGNWLTNNSHNDYAPVWGETPGGAQHVAYQKFALGQTGWDIFQRNVDAVGAGFGTEDPVSQSVGHELTPAFNADGTEIVFASDRAEHFEIYRSPFPTGQDQRLTNTDFTGPQQIVFASQVHDPAAGFNNPEGDYELYLAEVAPTGQVSSVVQLTENDWDDRSPDVSPDGKWMVFASGREWDDGQIGDGRSELYVMAIAPEDPVTNPALRLTNDPAETPDFPFPANDMHPKFASELYLPGAADGLGDKAKYTVVWASNRYSLANNPNRDMEIFRADFDEDATGQIEIDGSNHVIKRTQQVTRNGHSDVTPSFSPDVSWLQDLSDVRLLWATRQYDEDVNPEGDYEIVWLVESNTGPSGVVPDGNFLTQNDGQQDIHPVWGRNVDPTTTDREWLVYQKFTGRPNGWDIYRMNPGGGGEIRVGAFGMQADDETPRFQPDGNGLIFASNRDGQFELYTTNLTGTVQTRMTTNGVAQPKIVFASERDSDYELYMMDLDGGNVVQLTDNDWDDRAPHISPDGNSIVFTSDRSGVSKVYVMPFDADSPIVEVDGVLAQRVSGESGVEETPKFSGDIEFDPALTRYRIAYTSNQAGNSDIFAVNADATLPATLAGGELVQVTRNGWDDLTPSFSPDQNPDPTVQDIRYVYATDNPGDDENDLEIADIPVYSSFGAAPTYTELSGAAITYYTDNEVDDLAPVWALNTQTGNERIAYQKFRSIDYDIFQLNPWAADPTATEGSIIINTAEDVTPAFSQDGTWLVWASNRDSQYDIFRARYNGQSQLQLTSDDEKVAQITGLAYVDDVLYAVAENGALYWVSDSEGEPLNLAGGPYAWDWGFVGVDPDQAPKYVARVPNAGPRLNFIANVTDEFGNPIQFSGLSAGPENVEGSKYQKTLFATSAGGDVYAMDTKGILQPVFADGSPSLDVPIGAATGLAFSNIDYNLWHVTERRGVDEGHGINASLDGSRNQDIVGEKSFYFGLEDPRSPVTISNQPGASDYIDSSSGFFQTYNMPGGAHGTLTTQPFSLKGYSSQDKPALYFNYFLETEGGQDYDAFRVYISDDGANWDLLGTNTDMDDYAADGNPDIAKITRWNGGQELYENSDSWRQARVDLSNYAGSDSLRLRFDFSTASDMQIGDPTAATYSAYLRAVAGERLRDGNYFEVDNQPFEFDMGYAVVMPNVAGSTIPAGETLTLTDEASNSRTFTFVYDTTGGPLDVPLRVFDADLGTVRDKTSYEVAETLTERINAAFVIGGLQRVRAVIDQAHPDRVFLNRVTDLSQSIGPEVAVEGDAPGTVASGAVPVRIRGDMTEEEVAQAIWLALDQHFVDPGLQSEGLSVEMLQIQTYPDQHPVWPGQVGDLYAELDGEGQKFTLGDRWRTVTFEFDTGDGVAADNIAVPFASSFSELEMATAIANAINGAGDVAGEPGLAITAQVVPVNSQGGNRYYVSLVGDPLVDPQYPNPVYFTPEVVADGGLKTRLAQPFANTAAKLDGSLVRMIGHGVTSMLATVSERPRPGLAPLGYSEKLFGDDPFRAFKPPSYGTGDRFRYFARGQDNHYEGVYIDDVIIGFAERGEMVTGAPVNTNFVSQDTETRYDPTYINPTEILESGYYQVEVRRGEDFGIYDPAESVLGLNRAWDTNARFRNALTIVAPSAGEIFHNDDTADTSPLRDRRHGQTFEISDGENRQLFRFVDPTLGTSDPGIPIYFTGGESSAEMAQRIVDAINGQVGAVGGVQVTARAISDGLGRAGGSSLVELAGATWVNGIDYIAYGNNYDLYYDDATGDWFNNDGHARTHIAMTRGEENREREQGQVLVEGNKITYSSEYAIRVDAGQRDGHEVESIEDNQARWPHPGATLPLIQINNQRLVPGVTLQNNVAAFGQGGGILISGDPNNQQANDPVAAVPFTRVVNNTIFGSVEGGLGVGIDINQNASPTLLNNIVAGLDTGVRVDGTSQSTVLGAMLYQNNLQDVVGTGLGTFPLQLALTDPLFVDAAAGNFYPVQGSRAIDSSVSALPERQAMSTVRQPLGIPDSPILAPARDLFGQLRVDDPATLPPGGMGQNVFKDRGAIDRVDFDGPTAQLIRPQDNDPDGVDRNPNPHDVAVIGVTLTRFQIQLRDGTGTGIDDSTVTPDSVLVYKDGMLLNEDAEYFFDYDASSDTITLSPAAGVWAHSTTYTIELTPDIRDVGNNPVQPNRTDGSTVFNVSISGLDYGDAPDAPYPTTNKSDGARHIITPGLHLGSGVSSERDARTNATATGDTLDDGVNFSAGILIGGTTDFTVIASADGYLDAWVDFNGDGDWDDPGERIFNAEPLSEGENLLSVTAPSGLIAQPAYARFRFSSSGGLDTTGLANDGEVEDYMLQLVEFHEDFGDAPDIYQTTLASNGPRHRLGSGLMLGDNVDAEIDGQPTSTARGDDENGIDDEDGVNFLDALVPGSSVEVDVEVSQAGGYLQGWIDFNGDGDFNDPGEQIFANQFFASTGTHTLSFDVPEGTELGNTYARFRLSSQPGLGVGGSAPDGEVEDYRVNVVEAPLDFGDAPAPYPTLLADDGARHIVVRGFHLGQQIDYEDDGFPNSTATGDDTNNLGDEDGVAFDTPLRTGHDATITVTASSNGGYLNAWIDFNGDGDWDDEGEQIFVDEPLSLGVNVLTFAVPRDLETAETFARFRFSSTQGLSYSTPADAEVIPDGEVEDYMVQVVAGEASISGYKFHDLNANGVWDLEPTDDIPEVNLLAPNAGEAVLPPADDMASSAVALGFDFEFFGRSFHEMYVGTNGIVSFTNPVTYYGDGSFLGTEAMLAPFWTDVDTRASGRILVATGTSDRGNPVVQINWVDVGYFDQHADKRNTFSLYLEDDPGGDIAVFHYWDMNWTTGDAFGTGGFGEPGALIGYDAGDGVHTLTVAQPSDSDDLDDLMAQEQYGFRFDPRTGNPLGIEPGLAGVEVYLDLNNNGLLDADEPSVLTQVDDPDTPLIDETGYYEFTGLFAGEYVVREVLPGSSWTQTHPDSSVLLPDGQTQHLRVVAGSAISDGQTFSLANDTDTVIFEFDNDSDVADGNVAVPFTSGDSVGAVAASVAQAINDAGLAISAQVEGDIVTLSGDTVIFDAVDSPITDVTTHGNDDGSYTVTLTSQEELTDANFGNVKTPHVSIVDTAVAEGNSGTTTVRVTLELTESFGAPVTVDYATADGTATVADNDYIPASGSVTFPPQGIPAARWETEELTSNGINDYDYSVWEDRLVWETHDGQDWEIYLYDGEEIRRLTNNTTNDRFPAIHGRYVTWSGSDGNDYEIYLYDIETDSTRRLTNNDYDDKNPQVSDSYVVWWGNDGTNQEIFLYDIDANAGPINISDNPHDDYLPVVSGRNVAWYGSDGFDNEIYVYTDGQKRRVTNNTRDDRLPAIDGNRVVWQQDDNNDSEIGLYEIDTDSITMLTANNQDDVNPVISGDYVAWQGHDGSDSEIYAMDLTLDTTPVNVSDNSAFDELPQLSGNRLVWHSFVDNNWEVYYQEIGSDAIPQNISRNAAYDWYPQVTEDLVVWRSYESDSYEIMIARQSQPAATATLEFEVVGDLKIEPDEYFLVNLTGSDLALIDDSQAVVGIYNDDGSLDFGDAPVPYPTLLADNGARHLESNLRLGTLWDAEKDGQPSPNADADDRSISDDEDGVVFDGELIRGGTSEVTVIASAAGKLDAWIDFNGDSDWDDPGERIFAGRSVSAGSNALSFQVPVDAKLGKTMARFRLSSSGVDAPTGFAFDGEVEDYAVAITTSTADVNLSDGRLVVTGGDGEDQLSVAVLGNLYRIVVNGSEYEYAAADVDEIVFNADGGQDTVSFTGTAANESATLRPTSATFQTPGLTVTASDVERNIFFGEGGNDTVALYGSPGNDNLQSRPGRTVLDGPSYAYEVNGTETVHAYGEGGSDTAELYGTPNNDNFRGEPTFSRLTTADGDVVTATNFDTVTAHGEGGNVDLASLFDSVGDDTFVGRADMSTLNGGTGYTLNAANFSYVHAYGVTGGGVDVAHLYDSEYDDIAVMRPDHGKLWNDQGYFVRAKFFDYVHAYAITGGVDVGHLYDSPGDETAVMLPDMARMYNDDGYYARVKGFEYAHAYSLYGGNDVVRMYGSAGDDVLIGETWYTRLRGDGFNNRSKLFDTVYAYGGSGADFAWLRGSDGVDHLVAAEDNVTIENPLVPYYIWLTDFESVRADDDSSYNTKEVADATDYLLSTNGSWDAI